MTVTTAIAFGRTAKMDLPDIVRDLNAALGPTLVAALAGTTDTKAPIRWSKLTPPRRISPNYSRRLLVGHRAWSQLVAADGPSIARNWFLGANPLLDEDTPITAIREDRTQQVIAAVTAFVTDQPAT